MLLQFSSCALWSCFVNIYTKLKQDPLNVTVTQPKSSYLKRDVLISARTPGRKSSFKCSRRMQVNARRALFKKHL